MIIIRNTTVPIAPPAAAAATSPFLLDGGCVGLGVVGGGGSPAIPLYYM